MEFTNGELRPHHVSKSPRPRNTLDSELAAPPRPAAPSLYPRAATGAWHASVAGLAGPTCACTVMCCSLNTVPTGQSRLRCLQAHRERDGLIVLERVPDGRGAPRSRGVNLPVPTDQLSCPGGARPPTTKCVLLGRGCQPPHEQLAASGGGGVDGLRSAGGVPSDLPLAKIPSTNTIVFTFS